MRMDDRSFGSGGGLSPSLNSPGVSKTKCVCAKVKPAFISENPFKRNSGRDTGGVHGFPVVGGSSLNGTVKIIKLHSLDTFDHIMKSTKGNTGHENALVVEGVNEGGQTTLLIRKIGSKMAVLWMSMKGTFSKVISTDFLDNTKEASDGRPCCRTRNDVGDKMLHLPHSLSYHETLTEIFVVHVMAQVAIILLDESIFDLSRAGMTRLWQTIIFVVYFRPNILSHCRSFWKSVGHIRPLVAYIPQTLSREHEGPEKESSHKILHTTSLLSSVMVSKRQQTTKINIWKLLLAQTAAHLSCALLDKSALDVSSRDIAYFGQGLILAVYFRKQLACTFGLLTRSLVEKLDRISPYAPEDTASNDAATNSLNGMEEAFLSTNSASFSQFNTMLRRAVMQSGVLLGSQLMNESIFDLSTRGTIPIGQSLLVTGFFRSQLRQAFHPFISRTRRYMEVIYRYLATPFCYPKALRNEGVSNAFRFECC